MRTLKTLAAAVALSTVAVTAQAGGMTEPVMEPAPVVVAAPAPGPVGSVNSGYVVLGLLAALVAASGSF